MGLTIRATLGSKLIPNAAAFFRNDVRSCLDELIQNARRAGATRVDFHLAEGSLAIRDDGTGLAKEDAEVLLALGSSAHGGGIERDEAAAGIGFFALAHHVVRVRTQDWRCTITPGNFVGVGDVVVEDGLPDMEGMEVVVDGFYGIGRETDVTPAVKASVLHSGLRATLTCEGMRPIALEERASRLKSLRDLRRDHGRRWPPRREIPPSRPSIARESCSPTTIRSWSGRCGRWPPSADAFNSPPSRGTSPPRSENANELSRRRRKPVNRRPPRYRRGRGR